MRRAKIVCTLGPASRDPAVIGRLIDEGMDVARLNFSHGTREDHARTAELVRAEAKKRDRAVAILQDLQGPKIRVGTFSGGFAELEAGRDFLITAREIVGSPYGVSTTYARLAEDVKPGAAILLDDGLLQLEVSRVDGPDVWTRVIAGGILKDHKGINLPGVRVSAPAVTEKDAADLQFGLDMGADFVALSFVRDPEDVLLARRLATRDERRLPVIAKLEKPEAVDKLEAIVDAADGVLVARGDLGVELGPEKVPLVQKRAIDTANQRGKVVITATQMLESMILSPRPTRAEASDVANAVLDGSDALMLSGETASGRYPVLAVKTMAAIICEVEASARFRAKADQEVMVDLPVTTNAIAHAAVVAARQLGLPAIAVYTESGGMARLISEYRPASSIIAITPRAETYRRLALYWGVTPRLLPPAPGLEPMLAIIEAELKSSGFARPGQMVAVTLGMPVGSGESTNLLKLHRVS
ncbi:MAG TPA: pyruvate kinase [Polyangia bacterium]|nr:pyruvate kinase [Polyangia bacterium]